MRQYTPQVYTDSLYLLQSNKLKSAELLAKKQLSENDIIDIYISLHIVLEVSLNALHRHIITSQIIKPIDRLEVTKNIDGIGFIEKTILFIYNAHFVFYDELEQAAYHHKIIGKLRSFAGIRNKLLHGHSIGSLTTEDNITHQTEARINLNVEKLKQQLKLFVEIHEGMKFFLDHLDVEGWNEEYIEDLKVQYLSYDFIPEDMLKA